MKALHILLRQLLPTCLLAGAALLATTAVAQTRERRLSLSLINLIATPERYHGKLVHVTGYIFTGMEHMSICPYQVEISNKDCIWLNIDSGPYASDVDKARYAKKMAVLEKFQGKPAGIFARFNKNNRGHFGLWSGELTKIVDVYDPKDLVSAREVSVWK